MDSVASIADEKLRKDIQKIMTEDQMDPQGLSDSLSKTVNPNDITKFNIALDKSSVNIDSVTSRLDQMAVSLDSFDASLADSVRNIEQTIPGVISKLDARIGQSPGVEYQNRLSDFMSSVKQKLDHMANVAAELAQKPDLSQQDLMRIQYEVMQMSVVLDVASKVGDKGSQALQTLFRDK
ncbi:MAG: hypothetical protein LBB16_00175 [Puniceicoccales bacterium]|nr:hypothetical protein [Puniceicoccales bacterium]